MFISIVIAYLILAAEREAFLGSFFTDAFRTFTIPAHCHKSPFGAFSMSLLDTHTLCRRDCHCCPPHPCGCSTGASSLVPLLLYARLSYF